VVLVHVVIQLPLLKLLFIKCHVIYALHSLVILWLDHLTVSIGPHYGLLEPQLPVRIIWVGNTFVDFGTA
jgi:hypothetical protein